jgi:hypothetical protein
MNRLVLSLVAIAAAALSACSSQPPAAPTVAEAIAPPPAGATKATTTEIAAGHAATEVKVTAASFSCIRDMQAVRGYFVGNLLGQMGDTLAAANNPNGAPYPPGSVVQLVPGEAMVKLHKGASPATNDWEFFELDPQATGTVIKVRGFAEAKNQFGGNCLACHAKAQPQFDMICEKTHGCDPIPLTPVLIQAIQNTDPRCAPVALTDEQKAALQQLVALRAAAAARPAQ